MPIAKGTAKLFDLICAGYLRAIVSAKVRRARWEENLDTVPHLLELLTDLSDKMRSRYL